jgi:membrane protein DedA with SNARE-associated domain
MEKITGPLIEYGLALVFANVLITRLGVPLPAIPTLVVAGALTQQGYSSVPAVIAGASLASVLGDLPWYYAGRRFGSRAINALCRIAVERDICARQAHDIFQRWGAPSLMIGRLIPGVARMAPPVAGAFKLGFLPFLAYSAVGAAIWSGLAVEMGAIFHVEVNRVLEWAAEIGGWAALAIGIIAGLYVAFKWLQRRSFIGRTAR